MQVTQTPVVKWGNSHGIRIPKKMLNELNVTEKDVLEITLLDDSIIVRPTQKKNRTTKEIIEEFYKKDFETAVKENDYDFEIADFGAPEGEEIW
ncbi:MAG: AbrB/MazE/SpoVT family DNA-binding domain-containing protein [Nitrososphaerota archaeon]|jgi:antitoxin MazE|nr:AbrB/MazE/SpoVT family DNA-binding domain-containing protein [Nitrososphaerota archaeon]